MSSEKQVHPGPRRDKTKYAIPKDLEKLWQKIVSDWKTEGKDSFIFQFLSSQKEGKRDMLKFVESYLYDIETGRRNLSKQPLSFVLKLCDHLRCSPNDLFEQDSGWNDMEAINQLINVRTNFLVPLRIDPYSGNVIFLKNKVNEKNGIESCLLFLDLDQEYEAIYYHPFQNDDRDYPMPIHWRETPTDIDSLCCIPEKRIFVEEDGILINRVSSLDSIPTKYRSYFIEDPLLKHNRKMDLDKQIYNATGSQKTKKHK